MLYVYSGNLAGSDGPVDIDGVVIWTLSSQTTLTSPPFDPQVFVNDGTGQFKRTDYPIANFPGDILSSSTHDSGRSARCHVRRLQPRWRDRLSYMSSTWDLGYSSHWSWCTAWNSAW